MAVKPVRIPQWSQVAEIGLNRALTSDDAKFIKAQVNTQKADLFFSPPDSYFVLRKESEEMVLVAFQGSNIQELCNWIHQHTKNLGLKTIRFHTSRPALQRLVKQFNFQEVERVYRMEV